MSLLKLTVMLLFAFKVYFKSVLFLFTFSKHFIPIVTLNDIGADMGLFKRSDFPVCALCNLFSSSFFFWWYVAILWVGTPKNCWKITVSPYANPISISLLFSSLGAPLSSILLSINVLIKWSIFLVRRNCLT